jgi:hypothetical protein
VVAAGEVSSRGLRKTTCRERHSTRSAWTQELPDMKAISAPLDGFIHLRGLNLHKGT